MLTSKGPKNEMLRGRTEIHSVGKLLLLSLLLSSQIRAIIKRKYNFFLGRDVIFSDTELNQFFAVLFKPKNLSLPHVATLAVRSRELIAT